MVSTKDIKISNSRWLTMVNYFYYNFGKLSRLNLSPSPLKESKWLFTSVVIHCFGFVFLFIVLKVQTVLPTEKDVITIDINSSDSKFFSSTVPQKKTIAVSKPQLISQSLVSNSKTSSIPDDEKKDFSTVEKTTSADSMGLQTHHTDLKSIYISKLVEQIEQHKVYPRSAKILKQSGEVWISIKIKKNGELTNLKLEKPSPYEKLNQAAIQLVASLKNTAPIPKELHLETWQVTIPIAYVLR